jgi:hypothetical protein
MELEHSAAEVRPEETRGGGLLPEGVGRSDTGQMDSPMEDADAQLACRELPGDSGGRPCYGRDSPPFLSTSASPNGQVENSGVRSPGSISRQTRTDGLAVLQPPLGESGGSRVARHMAPNDDPCPPTSATAAVDSAEAEAMEIGVVHDEEGLPIVPPPPPPGSPPRPKNGHPGGLPLAVIGSPITESLPPPSLQLPHTAELAGWESASLPSTDDLLVSQALQVCETRVPKLCVTADIIIRSGDRIESGRKI